MADYTSLKASDKGSWNQSLRTSLQVTSAVTTDRMLPDPAARDPTKVTSQVLPNITLPFARITASCFSLPYYLLGVTSPLRYFPSQYDKVTEHFYLLFTFLGLLFSFLQVTDSKATSGANSFTELAHSGSYKALLVHWTDSNTSFMECTSLLAHKNIQSIFVLIGNNYCWPFQWKKFHFL